MMPETRTVPDPSDMADEALLALCGLAGVQPSYQDGTRKWRAAPAAALRRILAGLGLPADDERQARRSLDGLRRARVRPGMPDVVVAWSDAETRVPVRLEPSDVGTPIGFRILFEDGGERDWTVSPRSSDGVGLYAAGAHSVLFRLPLPRRLPFGYHILEARIDEVVHRAHLLVAPSEAPRVARPEWGVFAPTYGLPGRDGWPVGTFADLARLAEWVRALDGDVVATLPLLDTFLDGAIVDPSPYAPVSRRFWNGLYVDPRIEPEAEAPQVQRLFEDPDRRREAARLAAMPHVDHAAVWAWLVPVLRAMAEALHERDSPRRRAHDAFLRQHPDILRYARFRAATEEHGPWQTWPEEAQEGDLDALEVDEGAVRMHAFVQWVADRQVARIESDGRDAADPGPASAPLRLHLDLPLGAHASGYDTWNDRAAYAIGVETGAPPDGFFEKGQKWGFSPLNPRRLRQSGYRHFAACLRHHLRHARLLRIDHVMGLHRQFWVPSGHEATDGAYVHYATDEMFATVLIEAQRADALLVGEDLGTVPRAVREAMDKHHLHRTYVFQLQTRHGNGSPPDPTPNSLATLNTHDMVPFAAWWRGADIEERRRRGFLDAKTAAAEHDKRERLKRRVEQTVVAPHIQNGSGTANKDAPDARLEQACEGALRFLFGGDAALVVVNLEDLWLEEEPQNRPGYGPDSPEGRLNWSHRLRVPDFMADPAIAARLRALANRRPTTTADPTRAPAPAAEGPEAPATATRTGSKRPRTVPAPRQARSSRK